MRRFYVATMKNVSYCVGCEVRSPRLPVRRAASVYVTVSVVYPIALVLSLAGLRASAGEVPRNAGQAFSFAVTADPRQEGPSWRNALREIRDMTINAEPAFAPPSWVIVAGDMDPARKRFEDYTTVFSDTASRPPLVPVVGNHDTGFGDFTFIRDVMIPSIRGVVRREPDSCDYYFDYRNVRMIVVDAYTKSGKKGVIRKSGREWVKNTVETAPVSIDHIFLSFHEPAFPRGRHLKDSFNEDIPQRDAFWRMLISCGRVRAVFVGHTHGYNRLRILNPESAGANDAAAFPDDEGGIYQVDAGAAGHGATNTFVRVQVEGKNVSFRTYEAINGPDQPFFECDRWELSMPGDKSGQ